MISTDTRLNRVTCGCGARRQRRPAVCVVLSLPLPSSLHCKRWTVYLHALHPCPRSQIARAIDFDQLVSPTGLPCPVESSRVESHEKDRRRQGEGGKGRKCERKGEKEKGEEFPVPKPSEIGFASLCSSDCFDGDIGRLTRNAARLTAEADKEQNQADIGVSALSRKRRGKSVADSDDRVLE